MCFKKKGFMKSVSRVCIIALLMSIYQTMPMNAQAYEIEKEECVMFARNNKDETVFIEADNVCINGDIIAKGEIYTEGFCNVNGNKIEYVEDDILLKYDIGNRNVFKYKLLYEDDVTFCNDTMNYNDIAIISKYGNVLFDCMNVSISGVIYAPFGKVIISADNINLNGVIIVANEINLNGKNVNINYGSKYEEIYDDKIEFVDIPVEDWGKLEDENINEIPDVLEDTVNWKLFLDSDIDGVPDIIEKRYNFEYLSKDSDFDGIDDYNEMFVTYTDVLLWDSDCNGISDAEEDFDGDLISNEQELLLGTDPYFCDDETLYETKEYLSGNSVAYKEKTEEYNIALLSLEGEEVYTRTVSLQEFKTETKNIQDDIDNYLEDYGYDVYSSARTTDESSSFVSAWNNMAERERHYTICVINCHGEPQEMYNGLGIIDIIALKKVDCDVLLLLGCNCGHSDFLWSNMAYYMSKKVTGVVVASDGTVNSGITNILGLTQKFNSIVDPEFDRHCNEDRNNNGWVIYEYNPTTDNCTWYTTNLKTITIKILFNYLDKTGFIDI